MPVQLETQGFRHRAFVQTLLPVLARGVKMRNDVGKRGEAPSFESLPACLRGVLLSSPLASAVAANRSLHVSVDAADVFRRDARASFVGYVTQFDERMRAVAIRAALQREKDTLTATSGEERNRRARSACRGAETRAELSPGMGKFTVLARRT